MIKNLCFFRTFAFLVKRLSKRIQICDDQISSNDCTKYCRHNGNNQPIYSFIDLNAKGLFQKVIEKMLDKISISLIKFQYFT